MNRIKRVLMRYADTGTSIFFPFEPRRSPRKMMDPIGITVMRDFYTVVNDLSVASRRVMRDPPKAEAEPEQAELFAKT